ncbi:MAG: SPOR domain-containing protein [Paracoccaceae bacterium]|nr:SPOR domain-containing protein [Paracoccaceae bacterium]
MKPMNLPLAVRTGMILAAVSLGLSGCVSDFKMPQIKLGKKKEAAQATAPTSDKTVKLVERDVEAPDVFQVTDMALWDGRPSLGGVWVAYPGDIQPERVIIRNKENGKFVIGALFKRERDNPGPKFQLSSDAAAALGVLAGKPTKLNVTALRREQVPVEPPKPAKPPKPTEKPAKGDKITSIAAAAIDKAESRAKPKPNPKRKTAASAKPKDVKTAPAKQARTTSPAAPQKPVSPLAEPYIQIGIFSVEQNARNTATALQTKGVLPIVKAQESRGKKFWRVLIGPAQSKSERAVLLKKARKLGFNDAYFVSR